MKYTSPPKGLWPLSKNSISDETHTFIDVSANKIPSDNGISAMKNLGFNSRHSPIGLSGSPIISGTTVNFRNYIILDYRGKILSWSGVSVLIWIKIEVDQVVQRKIVMVRDYLQGILQVLPLIAIKYF